MEGRLATQTDVEGMRAETFAGLRLARTGQAEGLPWFGNTCGRVSTPYDGMPAARGYGVRIGGAAGLSRAISSSLLASNRGATTATATTTVVAVAARTCLTTGAGSRASLAPHATGRSTAPTAV